MKNKGKTKTKKEVIICPNWETCSVPKCPLDPDVDLRVVLEGEEVCPIFKGRRFVEKRF